jgi:DNA replication initiation complex subunit (GINS family)
MNNDITYDTLWQLTQKEKQSNELQQLPKTFYDDINIFIKSLEDGEEEQINVKKNTIKLINELFERRKQKILIYVAYKKQIPQPAIQKEQSLYTELHNVLDKTNFDFGEAKPNKQEFRSLQTIPEIILPSGKKVGPFEKDQIVELNADEEDIKFLLTNTLCKRI